MTYPQTNANEYALNAQEFFRLNTEISSAGDIYESEQGCHALAIGPESDISRVNITYYDRQATNFVQQTQISPDRAFVGRIDAVNNAGQYQPSGRPGRILIWPDEIYDPLWRPDGFAVGDVIQFLTPRLDVIQYFSPQNSLVSRRNNRTFYAQNFPIPINGAGPPSNLSYILMVPFYGRRYASIQFTNWQSTVAGAADLLIRVDGVNFTIIQNAGGTQRHARTPLVTSVNVPSGGGQLATQILASADGMYDMLLIELTQNTVNPGPMGITPLKVVISDEE